MGGAFALSHLFEMTSTTPALALMVGLAVGIDYALFIVNRQRRLVLHQDLDAKEATARAVGTAGSAVFFAGLTVIIALASLSIIGISMLTTMAFVAAATVLLAVLIAGPACSLLGLVGEKIASAKARAKRAEMIANEDHGFANRVADGHREAPGGGDPRGRRGDGRDCRPHGLHEPGHADRRVGEPRHDQASEL